MVNELRAPAGNPRPASVPARTCYDHLSGRLGVALYDSLVEAGALTVDGREVRLGEDADRVLERFGVTVPAANRRLMAYACLDASEGRPHLGGALGAELARAFAERGWIELKPSERRATITRPGRRALAKLLGADAVS